MSSKFTNYAIAGTFRPKINETTFVFTLEPTLQNRPIIMYFMVDGSHSMRFYIDEAKTVQRQTIIQTVSQMAINSSSIIQDGDYIGLNTFSTEIKNLLDNNIIEITEESRAKLDTVVTTTLKSDGGQTNYGKAFDYLLKEFEEVKKTFSTDSPHLTGPILVWFLTDGRPWPEGPGNTEEDILDYARKIGLTGNELWIIGISQDANKTFLNNISLASQQGAGNYQKSLQDVPKEFLLEQLASQQTLWVDLDFSSQERLIHGLVNAIEAARVNIGLIAEIQIVFENLEGSELNFLTGVNQLERSGNLSKITLKRFDSLKIGQKLSMAFSLQTDKNILMQTRLISITTILYRGADIISSETNIYNQPLYLLIKEEEKIFKGAEKVRNDFSNIRNQLLNYTNQINDLITTIEAFGGQNIDFNKYSDQIAYLRKLFEQRKGLSTISNGGLI